MNVYLNKVTGIDDALEALLMSKRSWTLSKAAEIRNMVYMDTTNNGQFLGYKEREKFNDMMEKLVRIGIDHITLLRFIDFSFTVEGIHRAGQDDWDSHAKRFENRIVRSSTRLADFESGEKSDYYKDKILTTDEALQILEQDMPDVINANGNTYVRGVNGYILKGFENNRDVKRGLYMLSIPSNFIYKINLTEFAHVYKERNKYGTANPEVKELCEMCADEIEKYCPWFTRDVLMRIKN